MRDERTSEGDCVAVLLVGATPHDARVVSCGLKREDVSVDVAADVRTAIDRLAAGSDAEAALPALVVLDLTTNPADSLTVLKAIRASPRLGTLPTVALVNHTVPTDETRKRVRRAYECGVNGHVAGADDIKGYADAIQAMTTFWFDRVSVPPKSLYLDRPSIQYD